MVILVRPNSMFLKCLNVTARPATIAGRYNRSRQFNLGRRTVTAMDPQRCCTGLNRFEDHQWLLGSLLHPNSMPAHWCILSAAERDYSQAIGLRHLRPRKRAKSASVEAKMELCSTASAARCASETRLPVALPARNKLQCCSVG